MKAISSVPDYFNYTGLKETPDRFDTLWAFVTNQKGKTTYEIMNQDKARMENFMMAMAVFESVSHGPPFGSYDFSWIGNKIRESTDRVLLVDIGGGQGHLLKSVLDSYPELPANRCACEDLAEVVQEAAKTQDPVLKNIQFVPADFFAGQPIEGKCLVKITFLLTPVF